MSDQFIGSLVSLNCGEVLGTYQGQIVNVDSSSGKITIVNAYQNGIACSVPRVTLNACDIYNLRIVKNATEAQSATPVNKHIRPAATAPVTVTVPRDINVSVTNEITSALRSIGINIAPRITSNSGDSSDSVPAPIYDGLILPNANNNCIPIHPSPERSKLSPSKNIILSNGKKSRNGVVSRAATVSYTSNVSGQSCGQGGLCQGKDFGKFQGLNQGEARPRSVNGKKSPPVGNVVTGNSLNEGSRSKSAGDFIGMTSAEFLSACSSQQRKDDVPSSGSGSRAARCRTTSACEELNVPGQSRKSVTPRKDRRQMETVVEQQRHQQQQPQQWSQRQQRKNQSTREDCFTASVDNYMNDEFDFESNLALFNKQAVYDEIEKDRDITGDMTNVMRNGEAKYRHDENILPTVQAVYRQIKLKSNANNDSLLGDAKDTVVVKNRVKEYITDLGLIVPSISSEMKRLVLDRAESVGFTKEKRLEILGRSSAEMSMQLLGGATRFNPKNCHQMPVVVVVTSGGCLQAAVALCCARHLATRSVSVIVLMPKEQSGAGASAAHEQSISRAAEVERNLFLLTGGRVISKLSDIPGTHVDLIITCVGSSSLPGTENPEQKANPDSRWLKTVSDWANNCKAQVLAVDPPVDGAGFVSKWCLTDVLPIDYDDVACGQVHLCDICLPGKILDDVGVSYLSPFAHKYILPLHTV